MKHFLTSKALHLFAVHPPTSYVLSSLIISFLFFLTLFFSPCFEIATALFHICSLGNTLGLGHGRDKIKLESKPACCSWEVRLVLPLLLEPPPLPRLFFRDSWDCEAGTSHQPLTLVRGLWERAEYRCCLTLISLDQGALSPYLKADSKAKLPHKSSSVLQVDSLSMD